MRRAPRIALAPEEERVLTRWAAGGEGRDRRARRSLIVLGAARGRTNAEIAAELATHPETVARWRSRFVVNGLEGVEREAPRSGDARRVPASTVARILEATADLDARPAGGWSTRTLARTLRVNHMLVHRVWRAHGLLEAPDPRLPDRAAPRPPRVDLAGAILTPVVRAVVFSVLPGSARGVVGNDLPAAGNEVRLDELLDDPAVGSRNVIRSVRRLERIRSRELRSSASAAPLLIFLRGIERRLLPGARLDVVVDRRPVDLGPRTLAWLEARPRFRLYAKASRQSWSAAVAVWAARWERRPIDPRSFRQAHLLDRAFPARRQRAPRAFERFSWTPADG